MTTSVLRTRPTLAPSGTSLGVPLEAEVDVALVGGKAHTLGRLIRSGVRVPPGFVLRTEALESHLREARIADRIHSLCEGSDFGRAEARSSVSATIRALVCGAALPEVIRDELLARAHPLLARGS